MERPPKKYVCEKCGYLGDTSEHEGCDYLAWTTGEQLYIDQLEAELAALRASPVGAPEGQALWDSVYKTLRGYHMTMMVDSEGDGYPLIDAMSPEHGTVTSGIEECTYLADAIYNDLLAAAPTPPVSEDRWLPIATAPKDEFVLLAGPSGYTTIETVFATGRMCSDYHVGRWIDHANDDLTDWGFEPTHWMPLPKAPEMEGK